MSSLRLGLPALACAFISFAIAAPAARAVSPDVVISQVYGGGGNNGAQYQNDFIELHNTSTSAASLTGMSLAYSSPTTGNTGGSTSLSGSIPAGGYFLIQEAAGAANPPLASLPAPNATGTLNMGAASGRVDLLQSTTLRDRVGWGTGAGLLFEGASAAPTLSNSLAALRAGSGCTDTDNNGADFTSAAPAPRNAATAAFSCSGSTNPTGTGAATPASVVAGGTSLLTVAVTGATNPASTGVTVQANLAAIGGSATQAFNDAGTGGDATAGDNTFSYQATVDPGTSAGLKSLPFSISDAQSRTGSGSIALTVAGGCEAAYTPIHAIQGSGATSPLSGSPVTTQGVVVGDYQGPGEFDGYYIQDAAPDTDPATSEGIFVFDPGGTAVSPGDVVRVAGTVTEFGTAGSTLTELGSVTSVSVCSSGASVTPTEVTLPVSTLGGYERYEGMLVHFSQTLTATETFTLGRFGEVSLAEGGRLFVPTAVTTPGAAANAQEDLNRRRSFVLDDANDNQNIDPTRYPLGGLSAANTLRSGYTATDLTLVFDQRFGVYRAQPVGSIAFTPANPRNPTPPAVGGNTKVAFFNVLNFFNGNGLGGGFPTSRGANDLTEYNRQLAKEVSALSAINADVFGLSEIENDAPPNSAVESLVSALNAAVGAGTYAYINTGVIGTDEIRVALIYKPAAVTPVGAFKTLTTAIDPRFIDTRNRPALAQTFMRNGKKLTVIVNHLKSKGSACDDIGDPDTGDGQGNCNHTRQQAAAALVDWIATDPTGSASPDTLLIGDMNSYTFEDPITTFTNGGFVNLTRDRHGLGAYSYVFDGESGYLDHALATPSLASKVTGIEDWHINADEPIALDYNTEFKTAGQITSFYDSGPFRSSDHDPVLIGIDLVGAPTATTGVASAITDTSASVAGTVNPGGGATNYTFEYGPTLSFGAITPVSSAGSGSTDVAQAATLSGLATNTTYYYRLVATSSAGTSFGVVRSFRTTGVAQAPLAVTGAASAVSNTGATLAGLVNPRGQQTAYTIEYGTSTAFGSLTPVVALDDGDGLEPVSATLSGLAQDTTYLYRVVASNATGTAMGAVASFTTGPGGAPIVTTGAASAISATSATLAGMVDPHGSPTAYTFEYGTTTAFGSIATVADGGSSNGAVSRSQTISGLAPGTTYRYRIVATNANGTTTGAVASFTTSAAGSLKRNAGRLAGQGS